MATLSIKRKFFDLIARGEKRIEYRARRDYYDKLFSKSHDTLTLHYYKSARLKVRIKKIVKTREWYEIYLGDVLEKKT